MRFTKSLRRPHESAVAGIPFQVDGAGFDRISGFDSRVTSYGLKSVAFGLFVALP